MEHAGRRPGRGDRRGGGRSGAVIRARPGSAEQRPRAGERLRPGRTWVDRADRAVVASGRWRRPRTFDALGPADARSTTGSGGAHGRSSPSPPTTTSGLASHPAVVAAAHAGDRSVGRRRGGVPPDHRLPARPRASWSGPWPNGRMRARRCLPDRVRRQPVGVVGLRARMGPGSTRTSSTTPRSSTGAVWPGPAPRCFPTATWVALDDLPGRFARTGGHRVGHRVLHGRGRGRASAGLVELAGRHACLARAGRGPRRPRARPA